MHGCVRRLPSKSVAATLLSVVARRFVCAAKGLRQRKDALGSLVALEMGKIKREGDG